MNKSFDIVKLTIWKTDSWVRVEEKSSLTTLRIYYDQLLITMNDKVVETFNLNGKIKGIYKGDVLILIATSTLKEIRKIKFQIKSNIGECLQHLAQCFPIMNHDSKHTITTKLRYGSLDEVFKKILEPSAGDMNLNEIGLPANHRNFIKLCLLDPTFSDLVRETQKILKSGSV